MAKPLAVINCCLRAFSIAAAAALCWSAPAGAGTIDRLKQDKTLRIAYREDAPPFSFTDSIGEPAGFMIDLCRSVAKNLATGLNLGDLKVDYVLVTAANRFDAIQSGKADLLCEPTSATLSRREQVDFSIATFVDGASLLVSGEGPSEFGALAGKKIGVLAGTTTEQSLRDTLASANVNAEVVTAKTHEEGLAMLDQGTIVAYFGDRAILAYLASKSSAPGKLR
ncbi:MAG: amino acid ABC transporter substrate-binding protein, partial [Roseiarcus sp.]